MEEDELTDLNKVLEALKENSTEAQNKKIDWTKLKLSKRGWFIFSSKSRWYLFRK